MQITQEERQKLYDALRGNAENNVGILMDKKDTSFLGSQQEEITDEEVISLIRSVPCHYENKFLVAWLNARPYCWAASIDGGKTWEKLQADNDEDSSEPIDEAAQKFSVATSQWELLDDPITQLK